MAYISKKIAHDSNLNLPFFSLAEKVLAEPKTIKIKEKLSMNLLWDKPYFEKFFGEDYFYLFWTESMN